jgi:sensor histidine kinase YesM
MNWTIKKKSNSRYHFLFWCVVWLFYAFFFSYNSSNITFVLAFSTILIPITAITTYAMVYVFIPKYLSSKKYLWFGISSLFTLLFTFFCVLLLLIISIAFIPELNFEDLPPMSRNYVYLTILVYLIVALVSFVSIWEKNTQTTLKNSELQKQLLTAKFKAKEQELTYLKNQIHPHFLFNTLNTIYGLALKKSIETPDVILKLSNLLDYILYQASKPEVSLTDEITHLEQYIDLEKVRFNDTLKVNFTKKMVNQDILVAPMLLLPFVENAFKHGNIIDGLFKVIISISVTDKELYFKIKNTYKSTNTQEGLGLKNIKERLEILYLKNYDLKIETKLQWFELRLKINHLKQNTYA